MSSSSSFLTFPLSKEFNRTPITITEAPRNTSERSRQPEFIIFCVYIAICWLVGVVGNLAVIVVYTRRKDKIAAHIFTIALAITDFLTCFAIMPFCTLQILHKLNYTEYNIFMNTLIFGIMVSVFILLAISVDRYYAVCKPLKYSMQSKKTPIVALILILVLASGYVALRYANNWLIFYVTICISLVICFLAMVCLYLVIFWKIFKRSRLVTTNHHPTSESDPKPGCSLPREASKRLQAPVEKSQTSTISSFSLPATRLKANSVPVLPSQGAHRNRQHMVAIARMFAVVTVAFVLAYLPTLLVIFRAIPYSYFAMYSYYLNHVCNPVIYGILNKDFRRDLKEFLRWPWCKH